MSDHSTGIGRRRFLQSTGAFALSIPSVGGIGLMSGGKPEEKIAMVRTISKGRGKSAVAVFYTGNTGWTSAMLGSEDVPTFNYEALPPICIPTNPAVLRGYYDIGLLGPSIHSVGEINTHTKANSSRFQKAMARSMGDVAAPYAIAASNLGSAEECVEAETLPLFLSAWTKNVIAILPAHPVSTASPARLETAMRRIKSRSDALVLIEAFPRPGFNDQDEPPDLRVGDGLVRAVDSLTAWLKPGSVIGVDAADVLGTIIEAGGGRVAIESFSLQHNDRGMIIKSSIQRWLQGHGAKQIRRSLVRLEGGNMPLQRFEDLVELVQTQHCGSECIVGYWPTALDLWADLDLSIILLADHKFMT